MFASAAFLNQPDTSKQFIVDVGASDSGVGAVSQQKEGKLNSYAFCP